MSWGWIKENWGKRMEDWKFIIEDAGFLIEDLRIQPWNGHIWWFWLSIVVNSPILRSILWIFCLWTLYTFFLVWHCKHPPTPMEMFYSNYVDKPDHLTFYSNEYCTVDWWQIWWKLFWKQLLFLLNIWPTSQTWNELQLRLSNLFRWW